MARNEEKHAGRLNRLWLQQLDEEKERKNPTRPGLGSLNSASEVKKWIPSIKRDIDFYLKQSQVACYPDRTINEFSSKIDALTKEYKAYVRKLKELQPQLDTVPWTERAYSRKHKVDKQESEDNSTSNSNQDSNEAIKKSRLEFSPLSTPVLDNDDDYSQLYGYQSETVTHVIDTGSDRPLEFDGRKLKHCDKRTTDYRNQTETVTNVIETGSDKPLEFDDRKLKHCYKTNTDYRHQTDSVGLAMYTGSDEPLEFNNEKLNHCDKSTADYRNQTDSVCPVLYTGSDEPLEFDNEKLNHCDKRTGDTTENQRNVLNLPYSDSSDEDG